MPDVSKWKIDNVNTIHGLFYRCESLAYLPDISKWKANKIFEMTHIFYHHAMAVNFYAPVKIAYYFLPGMIKRGFGRIAYY